MSIANVNIGTSGAEIGGAFGGGKGLRRSIEVSQAQCACALPSVSEPLFRDSFSCIAWTGNTEVGRSLTRDAFLRLGHVTAVLGRGRTPTLDQVALDTQGLTRRAEVRVPSFTLIPGCVRPV